MERKILYRIDTFLEFSLDSTILVLDHRVTIYIEEKNAGWKYSFIRPGFFPPNSEQHLSESIFEFLIVGCWNNPFFFFSFFFSSSAFSLPFLRPLHSSSFHPFHPRGHLLLTANWSGFQLASPFTMKFYRNGRAHFLIKAISTCVVQ